MIPNPNDTAREHLCEYTSAPIRAQSGLQARHRLVHALARGQLASDRQPCVADNQHTSPRLGECDATQKDIGPPQCGILVDAKFAHARSPGLGFEQRHLPTAASIDAASDTLIRDQCRLFHAIHWPAMRALDPDKLDTTHSRRRTSDRSNERMLPSVILALSNHVLHKLQGVLVIGEVRRLPDGDSRIWASVPRPVNQGGPRRIESRFGPRRTGAL